MKKHSTVFIRFFIFVVFASFSISSQAQASWQDVEGPGPNTGPASCGWMDMDASGNIYVLDYSSVKKFDGTSWSDLGDPTLGEGLGSVSYWNMTVSATGTVYFTFHYGTASTPSTDTKSYTSVNSGSGFDLLGGADMLDGAEAYFPCFDGVTMKAVVTDATSGSQSIKIRTYNTSWSDISSIPISAAAVSDNNSTMDHDNSGNAYLLFYDGGYKLYKITGNTVTQLGTTLSGPANVMGTTRIPFCVSPDGTPYFALVEINGSDYNLNVYKFNGTDWDLIESDVITAPDGVTYVSDLNIDVSSTGIIYVGYMYVSNGSFMNNIVYYTGNGTTWADVGTVNFGFHSLQVSSDNILYADGCREYDASGITVTGVVAADEAMGVKVATDAQGLMIECEQAPLAVEVYDLNGKLISAALANIGLNTSVPLQQEGMYILKVETSKGVMTKKAVFVR